MTIYKPRESLLGVFYYKKKSIWKVAVVKPDKKSL